MEKADQVAVIVFPFPAQGHLNQLLQLSCLISSYRSIPVYYVGSTIHNRQAKVRVNGINPLKFAKINFHDLPTPPFTSPPPDPTSSNKFPVQLQPAWDATLSLREPVASFLQEMSQTFKRILIIHDPMMAFVVQDVASIPNAESYAFNCLSVFSHVSYVYAMQGKPLPIEHPKELPSSEGTASDEVWNLFALQVEPLTYRAGDIHNTLVVIIALLFVS